MNNFGRWDEYDKEVDTLAKFMEKHDYFIELGSVNCDELIELKQKDGTTLSIHISPEYSSVARVSKTLNREPEVITYAEIMDLLNIKTWEVPEAREPGKWALFAAKYGYQIREANSKYVEMFKPSMASDGVITQIVTAECFIADPEKPVTLEKILRVYINASGNYISVVKYDQTINLKNPPTPTAMGISREEMMDLTTKGQRRAR